ncbi:MAG TPA: L,D-transpeptidase, partial [Iamia sp.]|nr:L,D-transpeptidase [Iamia sp.]
EVPNWVKVEVGARRLTVLHGDTPVLSTIVAVGKGDTPTPLGSFFVDGLVPLEPPDPAYGAGQVSVSAFSETLTSFGGGVGQIALHGTQATALLGQETSNGCVRLDNDAIRQVMLLAPTGTPVEIVA